MPLITMLVLMVSFPVAVYAQDSGGTEPVDYEAAFATFAALVAVIPFVVQAVKKLIPAIENHHLLLKLSVG